MIRYTLLFCFCIMGSMAYGQSAGEARALKAFNERTTKAYLNKIYIPEDLEDAYAQLDEVMEKDAKLELMKLSESEAPRKLHFMLGRWLIHNWSLEQGSRLSMHLRSKGIYRPDDMAKFLILTYHRKLHGRPLGIEALLADYKAKYDAEKAERASKRTVLSQETRIRKQQQ